MTDTGTTSSGDRSGRPPWRILVVDDEPDICTLSGFELRRRLGRDTVVDAAPDGQVALDAVRAGPVPDAIFTGLRMPVLDGFDAIAAIRATGYRRPIVAHSSIGDRPEVAQRALDAGADACFDKSHFQAAIERLAALLESTTA